MKKTTNKKLGLISFNFFFIAILLSFSQQASAETCYDWGAYKDCKSTTCVSGWVWNSCASTVDQCKGDWVWDSCASTTPECVGGNEWICNWITDGEWDCNWEWECNWDWWSWSWDCDWEWQCNWVDTSGWDCNWEWDSCASTQDVCQGGNVWDSCASTDQRYL